MMKNSNVTNIKDFIITGFPGLPSVYYGPVSVLLLLVFLAIVLGNTFVLIVILFERTLHKPMYIIFFSLALTDMAFGFVALPKIIARYWWDDTVSSFGACFAQMYFVHSLGAIQSFILLIMALDRFVAIWLPLRYALIFTNKAVSIACSLCWILTFIRVLGILFPALSLPYCDQNVIAQCYCDYISITRLGCGDQVSYVQSIAFGNAMLTLLFPLTFIIFSYFSIIIAVLKMSHTDRRYKALSTCAPQIFIACLYYVPRCFVYLANNVGFNFSLLARVIITMIYSLIPSAVNPVIYCLKTKEIRNAFMRRLKNRKVGAVINKPNSK